MLSAQSTEKHMFTASRGSRWILKYSALFDSYDIYDESGAVVYTVSGKPAWGHKLEIYDNNGNHLATLREQVLTFLLRFAIQIGWEAVLICRGVNTRLIYPFLQCFFW